MVSCPHPIPARSDAKEKITVENVNHPGPTERVDGAKYAGTKRAMLDVLPASAPGLTAAEIMAAVKPGLDPVLFPGGATADQMRSARP